MKLFKLAAIVLALCGAAFAQVTLNCPKCALGPLSYEAVLNADSISKGVILNNTDLTAVPLTWSITGPGFVQGGGHTCKSGTANPGKCTISVKYHPTLAASSTGTLTINVGTPNVTTAVPLIGTTLAPPPPVCVPPSTFVNGVCTPPVVTNKFVPGDRIAVGAEGVNVRSTAALSGTLLGSQAAGSLGTIVSGPTIDTAGDGLTRWNINYDSGVDGWSGEDYIAKSSLPPPPPGKSVQLKWVAPLTDGAASYNLYRDGVKVGSVVGSTLTFTNTAVPSGTYVYTARTVDSSGRESLNSNSVSVTIP